MTIDLAAAKMVSADAAVAPLLNVYIQNWRPFLRGKDFFI